MVNIVIPEGRSSGTIDVDSGQMNITTGGQHPYSMQQLADNNGLTDAMNQMNYESRMYDDQLHEENLSNDQDFSDEMDDSSEHHQNTEMQEYDQEQTEHRPRQRRKKSKDKRFDDLTRNYHLEREQREEYEKEVKRLRDDNARIKILEDEHAAMVLKLEQKEINDNLKKVSNIMIQAKEEDDNATYVKANLLMNKLSLKEAENERAYSQIQDRYNQYQQDVPDDDREQEVMQQLIKRADPRDLKSEYFNDFLNDHPYADARNLDEFDPDLADEFFSHKKKFDKALKLERRSNYIGTADYYDELNDVIKDEMHSKSYRRNKTQNRRQNQYQDEPSFDDDDDYNYEEDKMKKYVLDIGDNSHEYSMRDDGSPNYLTSDPSNSRLQSRRPVLDRLPPSPSHYNNQQQYHAPRGNQDSRQPMRRTNPNINPAYRGGNSMMNSTGPLPRLTEAQERIAINSPMKDAKGRVLDRDERIYQYKVNLQNMMQGR